MRATKRALAEALRTDAAVLVPPAQIYAVERATVPVLPSIEVIGISTERVDSGPMARHEMSCEITVGQCDRGQGRLAARWHRAGRQTARNRRRALDAPDCLGGR